MKKKYINNAWHPYFLSIALVALLGGVILAQSVPSSVRVEAETDSLSGQAIGLSENAASNGNNTIQIAGENVNQGGYAPFVANIDILTY